MEIMVKNGETPVVVFIDLKKAFDKVRYTDIFDLLMGMEMPKDVLQLL